MKNFFLFTGLILSAYTAIARISADDFCYDQISFDIEMKELNLLEQQLISQKDQNPSWLDNGSLSQFSSEIKHESFDPLIDNYGFSWGFCCWPIGFFVVQVNPNSFREERVSFLIGMSLNVAISAASLVIFNRWVQNKEFDFGFM